MHMLLPDSFTVRGADGRQQERIWTGDTVHAGARAVMVGACAAVCWLACFFATAA
jgi:hypothetical protein